MTPSQTFHDHVQELRRRIMWVILAIGISAGIAYGFRLPIIRVLQKPLGAPLFYTSPAGSFNFVLKLSMIIGRFIALPVIVYQLLGFIGPALPKPLKRGKVAKIIGASFLLALAGITFGFFIMVPMSLKFFAGYSSAQIKPLISANEYLTYVINNLLVFAVSFQIPLLILFINWIKPIKPGKLLHYQKHVVVGSFALALILPFTYDPISQFTVALPIVVLFYVSVILLWIVNRKRKIPAALPVAEPEPEIVLVPQPSFQSAIPETVAPAIIMPTQPQPVQRAVRTTDGIVRRSTVVTSRSSAHHKKRSTPTPVQRPVIQLTDEELNQGLSMDGLMPT